MARVSVRRVNEWDAPAMLKIYAPYVSQGGITPEAAIPQLSEYIQRIDRYTYGMGWLICEIDSQTAGFCQLTENSLAPEDWFSAQAQIYVKPEYKRRGVGRALLTLMMDIMQYQNRKRIVVGYMKPVQEAEFFLAAMGFRQVAEQDDAAAGRTICYMERSLMPQDENAEYVIKPYLIENADYEAARENAALLVR